ncbi:MAG: quinone oxidoreductase family protein [Hyphomonas sp.]
MSDAYTIQFDQLGGPEVLVRRALELAEPLPGNVRIRQSAIGLNFIDTYFRTGLYPAKLPFTAGMEGAGIVDAVGEGVSHLKVGDRVGHLSAGAYATHITVPADRVVVLPDHVSDSEAAAVLLKGLTAWMLLFEIRTIVAGDTVLVWAPVGGVGSLLLPWAKSLGARVIAVTSSEVKAKRASELGADETIVGYDNVVAQVREATGGQGVDVALDSVGKISADASLKSLKPKGWFITYGNASGAVEPLPPARLAQGGSLIMTRPTLFNYIDTEENLQRGADALFGALKAGVTSVEIGQTYALDDVAAAHTALEAGDTTGATVLIP